MALGELGRAQRPGGGRSEGCGGSLLKREGSLDPRRSTRGDIRPCAGGDVGKGRSTVNV